MNIVSVPVSQLKPNEFAFHPWVNYNKDARNVSAFGHMTKVHGGTSMERIIHLTKDQDIRVDDVFELQLAWFAGFMDGEGTFGIAFQSLPQQRRQKFHVRPAVQFSTTDIEAVYKAQDICTRLGLSALGYSYQERDPKKQLDAHYLRINRQNDLRVVCEALLPHLIIKQEACRLLLAFVSRRLALVELDEKGRMLRGGTRANPYTQEDVEIIEALCNLNGRRARDPNREQRAEKFARFKEAIEEINYG